MFTGELTEALGSLAGPRGRRASVAEQAHPWPVLWLLSGVEPVQHPRIATLQLSKAPGKGQHRVQTVLEMWF